MSRLPRITSKKAVNLWGLGFAVAGIAQAAAGQRFADEHPGGVPGNFGERLVVAFHFIVIRLAAFAVASGRDPGEGERGRVWEVDRPEARDVRGRDRVAEWDVDVDRVRER